MSDTDRHAGVEAPTAAEVKAARLLVEMDRIDGSETDPKIVKLALMGVNEGLAKSVDDVTAAPKDVVRHDMTVWVDGTQVTVSRAHLFSSDLNGRKIAKLAKSRRLGAPRAK